MVAFKALYTYFLFDLEHIRGPLLNLLDTLYTSKIYIAIHIPEFTNMKKQVSLHPPPPLNGSAISPRIPSI